MSYNAADEEDYVKLEAETSTSGCCDGGDDGGGWLWSLWWWAKLVLVVLFVAVLGAVFFKWIGPFFMDKEIIPVINWEQRTFSTAILGLIVFASLAIFPVFLIPSTPSMWVAGMTFGYGYGFLMIIGGVLIGSSIPYFIGSLFYHRIHVWLERHPKRASIIRLAGMVPEIFVALYTGILIKTLANASKDGKSLSVSQIVMSVAGFCVSVSATVVVTWYAKRRLKELQMREELLLH
ncbi:uncharacterized protein LOC125193988 isoform X2 [Salvia hispanica]|uniref:uncharacterized protein LOC125193988 isoform X2 n=1 Tax=Salvia hispanica TaxID=49212 RepID=UPI0020097964|nr:uncharacterized protein LOC125193988 isoform X2 [Salvia hispanica]